MKTQAISQKYQLIDDESQFRLQQLEGLANDKIKTFGKDYHIVSVIGSQSSGKSTLLNAIFNTEFDTLNRKKRVGQTTKGIWYSVDVPTKIMILDVEGSDSNQRQERTKIQRRNSLFALAVSHTLLINLWIQQIGLYKGSQLAILEIILQLNLKLFGSQKPKQIMFVVRDWIQENQNQEVLREKLFKKVEEAWLNIPKPPGKEGIKLNELFTLKAFFLPSKLEEKQRFAFHVQSLRKSLVDSARRQQLSKDNIPLKDFPLYMQNLWHTIQEDKDINLPQQKILLSNMRCHEIQKKVYEDFQEQFRDELQKSQRKMNQSFGQNIKAIVKKMIDSYNQQTVVYIQEEVDKIRDDFMQFLERKIELSFSYQVRMISEDCLKEFVEDVNKNFMKEKSIESIKELKPLVIRRFQQLVGKVSYRVQWIEPQTQKFTKSIEDAFQHQKQKMVSDSLKDFDRTIKKQVQGVVSNAFYDNKIFVNNFWSHINCSFKQIEHKAKNSIVGLYNKLQIRDKNQQPTTRRISMHVDKAKFNAKQQLKTIIKMKCNDLLYYVMRHFAVEFSMDEKEIPRQWVEMKPEEITVLYESLKKKYIALIDNFKRFSLQQEQQESPQSKGKLRPTSTFMQRSVHEQLLDSKQYLTLVRKLQEQMKNLYEQALKKNKQVYHGSIPVWGWVIFLLVAIDDIFLWLHSPYLAIPLMLVLIVVVVVFVVGGKKATNGIVKLAKDGAMQVMGSVTTRAAAAMINKQD